ncbi:hypothetical protein C5167_019996 [Papaver somniferum]|uniref:Uncharacterized protein n=1 Tax=Papaver somniferum TaxID=3469 RepID=A0A4Y7IRQ6_PAPSO|nr:hypothetical protein C5167_019996 [Papaver somniferum]
MGSFGFEFPESSSSRWTDFVAEVEMKLGSHSRNHVGDISLRRVSNSCSREWDGVAVPEPITSQHLRSAFAAHNWSGRGVVVASFLAFLSQAVGIIEPVIWQPL